MVLPSMLRESNPWSLSYTAITGRSIYGDLQGSRRIRLAKPTIACTRPRLHYKCWEQPLYPINGSELQGEFDRQQWAAMPSVNITPSARIYPPIACAKGISRLWESFH